MRALVLPILASSLLLAGDPQKEPQKLEGAKLQSVPGPFVDRYCAHYGQYADMAQGPGNSEIAARIRREARRSVSIPAVAVPSVPAVVSDTVGGPAGWKAYRVEVPGRATVKLRLHASHEAWFFVRALNKFGTLEKGMFQNLIPTGNPEASYTNPKDTPNTIFFVVDTTEMDVGNEPYELNLTQR